MMGAVNPNLYFSLIHVPVRMSGQSTLPRNYSLDLFPKPAADIIRWLITPFANIYVTTRIATLCKIVRILFSEPAVSCCNTIDSRNASKKHSTTVEKHSY